MPRYIVSGSNNVDRIIPFEDPTKISHAIGGGVNYALTAMSLFGEDILSVSYAGLDFDRYYGDWFRDNGFSSEGIVRAFEKTYRVDLVYQENGTYVTAGTVREGSVYGRNTPNMDLLRPWLEGPELRGLHLLCHGNAVFFEQLQQYRHKGIKIGYEMEVAKKTYVDMTAFAEEVVKLVDYFSVSITEAAEIWPGVRDERDALEIFAPMGCDVFFRMGRKGAYMVSGGYAYYSPMVDEFGSIDPTGCGNSSTAAAFLSLCEGEGPMRAAQVGAVAASLAAGCHGLVPKLTPELRRRCKELADEYTERAEGGIKI